MAAGLIDCIVTPLQGQYVEGAHYCADNGCYGKGYPGDDAWFQWLTALPEKHLCRFAVAPDVVGDAAATLERSTPWLPKIRALGLPAAFVAQDGQQDLPAPWDDLDVLFIGGTTGWKLGPAARGLVVEAKTRGKQVHMGRVNSFKRLSYAAHIGCDSADGTYLVFGPDTNLARLRTWLHRLDTQRDLFGGAA